MAFVLQIALAPAIALFSAQPNFLLAYAIVVAIVIPNEAGPVLPFVMGLLYDLTGTGPVGGMALLLVIACFIASRVFSLMDNDTLFMPLAIFVACALLAELAYGMLLMACGLAANPVEALVTRALPCALYDCAVGLVLYFVMVRLLAGGTQDRGLRTPSFAKGAACFQQSLPLSSRLSSLLPFWWCCTWCCAAAKPKTSA